jgi:subtilisin family serine protease
MSLGAPAQPGEAFSQIYENAARRALRRGTLIIAAAGNESRRQSGVIRPVGRPANCPSILAVAALDDQFDVAWFSCGGINPNGGEVNIAGPGVDVYSSWPMPTRNNSISGTSMATPHVAGIAALMVQAKPSASASEIGELLTQSAQTVPLPSRDAGAGLVQAP